MKKLLFVCIVFMLPSIVFAQDVILPVRILDASVPRYIDMMNAKYPKLVGETNKQQGQRVIILLLEKELRKYEREVKLQNARNEAIVTSGTILSEQ